MQRVPLVIHERLAAWPRQLRPRLAGWPVRWAETRSASDLEAAVAGSACPLVLLDAGRRPREALEALDRALRAAPNALVLVLDPGGHPAVADLARELGATHVLPGDVAPPVVAELLLRWLPLARRRAEADGWAAEPNPPAEPWDGAAALP